VISAWFRRPLVLAGLALVVLAAASGLLAYLFRDNLSRYTMKPSREFDRAAAPPAPDYRNDRSWARLPEGPQKAADVFFVYPIIYFGGNRWNARIDDPEDMERLEREIMPLYAGPFADTANLFAPKYRQANAYAFMTRAASAQNARKLAYEDVSAAFRDYLANRNGGRPFAIVAQGQGALHAVRLLREFVAQDEAVRARFLTAYLSELAVPADIFQGYLAPLQACSDGYQLGCVNVWHTTAQGARNDRPQSSAPVWTEDGGFDSTRGRTLACVNPLSWTLDGRAADETMNQGVARLSFGSKTGVAVTPGGTGADCWNGLLWVDEQPAPLYGFAGPRYRDLFPPTENLFFESVKQNFVLRLEALRQAASPPPVDGNDPQRSDEPAP
jgi:Protein of unknown function (DUF3089)